MGHGIIVFVEETACFGDRRLEPGVGSGDKYLSVLCTLYPGFISWTPCPNCRQDWWREDSVVTIRSGGQRLRLYCFLCGADVWWGGYVRPEIAEIIGEEGDA